MPEIPEYYKQARLQRGQYGGGGAAYSPAADRATQEAGAVITQFGMEAFGQFKRAEAADQFSTFQAETLTEVNEYMQGLDPKGDTSKWEQGIGDILLSRKNQRLGELTNTDARREAEQWLVGREVELKSKVFWAARNADTDKQEANLQLNINRYMKLAAEAPDDNQYEEYKAMLEDTIMTAGGAGQDDQDFLLLSKEERDLLLHDSIEQLETERTRWIKGMELAASKQQDILKAEQQAQIDADVAAADDEYTEAIAGGNFSQALISKIAMDPRLDTDGALRRSLINWTVQRASAVTTKKEATPPEKLQAEDEILNAIEDTDLTQKEKKAVLMERAWMFTGTENSGFLEKIRKPSDTVTDPILKDGLAAAERLRAAEEQAMATFSKEEKESGALATQIAESTKRMLEIKRQIRKDFAEHPEWTAEQKINAIESRLKPVKDKRAKDLTENIWQKLWKGLSSPPGLSQAKPINKGLYGMFPTEGEKPTTEPSEPYEIPPVDRFFYWEKIDDETRRQLEILEAGGDPKKLKMAHQRLKDKYGPVR